MARINQNYDKLAAGYLFPEIARRTNAFLNENPEAKVLRLGIGDTTEPIVSAVLQGLRDGTEALGSVETYSGYGASEGIGTLRQSLADLYAERGLSLDASEFFGYIRFVVQHSFLDTNYCFYIFLYRHNCAYK